MDRTGYVPTAKLRRRTRIQHERALLLQLQNLPRRERLRNCEVAQRCGSGTVELRVRREVTGAFGKFAGQQPDEFFFRSRPQSIVLHALPSDGGAALGAQLLPAERPCAVRG